MAEKKKSSIEEKAETRQELNKQGLTTDLDQAVDAAIAADKTIQDRKSLEEEVKEREEIIRTPDKPKWMPKRWGNQRLTIATPGHMIDDPFYIPEVVETNDNPPVKRRVAKHKWIRGQFHTLTADGGGKYRWCSRHRSGIHKRYGYRFTKYTGNFDKTGLFEQGPGDSVWNGDAVLMEISIDGWERMVRDTAKRKAELEGTAGDEFFGLSEQMGVHSFREDYKRNVREMMT